MLIGFSGKQRTGKDTSAEYLQSRHGGVIVKFADPLYEIEAAAYKIAGLNIDDYPKGRRRPFLQYIGTEWGRNLDPNLWIKIMDRRLPDLIKDNEHVYVTDVRFLNEVEILLKYGFKLIRLDRSDDLIQNKSGIDHSSETILDDYKGFHYRLRNNGDHLYLRELLDGALEDMQKRYK